MSKLLLLYSTIVVSLLFLLVPNNDVLVGYPFSDMVVSLDYYIYSIFEKFVLIVLAFVVANEATEHRDALNIFLWLMIADAVDYLLSYSSIWFHIGAFPVSMNVLKSVIFGGVILDIWIRKLLK